MNGFRHCCGTLFLGLAFSMASCAPPGVDTTPTISVTERRVPAKGWLEMHGTGFTPNHNVTSHLLQPDGLEFPELPILTDSRGEFTHDIDTLLLLVGTHELWVLDDATGVTSNRARFEVTREQPQAP